MTDQTDKMTTLILALTCERDELKKELERERNFGKEMYVGMGHERDDAITLTDELASSLKDVLALCAGGQKNEHTVKHARDVLAYHMMVSKVRAKESGE